MRRTWAPSLVWCCDVPAEDVADADVDEVEVVGEQLGLRALAAALHAHDHVLAHPPSLSRNACGRVWAHAVDPRLAGVTCADSISSSCPEAVRASNTTDVRVRPAAARGPHGDNRPDAPLGPRAGGAPAREQRAARERRAARRPPARPSGAAPVTPVRNSRHGNHSDRRREGRHDPEVGRRPDRPGDGPARRADARRPGQDARARRLQRAPGHLRHQGRQEAEQARGRPLRQGRRRPGQAPRRAASRLGRRLRGRPGDRGRHRRRRREGRRHRRQPGQGLRRHHEAPQLQGPGRQPRQPQAPPCARRRSVPARSPAGSSRACACPAAWATSR